MLMRYFGGGIGHLNNTPPQQADPLGSNSDEMDIEENENDTGTNNARDGPQDIVMKDGELEVDETEEEDRSGDNNDDGDDSDNYDYEENDEDEDGEAEAEEPTCGSDDELEEDDYYGYASP
jgi:hypothetical protein